MNNDFRIVPTSAGGLLGGVGGYGLASMIDADPASKALLTAAGAAVGGGLGYLGSRRINVSDTEKSEILAAREIMRRRNRRSRDLATAGAGAVGMGATVGLAPLLANKHHGEYVAAITKPHKEWAKAVRAAAEADGLAALNATTKKYGDALLGQDLTTPGLPYKMWRDKVRATAVERINKKYSNIAEKILKEHAGILTEADLTKPGVPLNMWRREVRNTAAKSLQRYIDNVDQQIVRNNGIIPSGLFVPTPGTKEYADMYKDRIKEAVENLKANKPSINSAYIPAQGSAAWKSELRKTIKDIQREMASDKPGRLTSYVLNPADMSVRGSLARKLKASRLLKARADLAGTKPQAGKYSQILGTLNKRKALYTGLGVAATLGAAGLANWLTKDPSLD